MAGAVRYTCGPRMRSVVLFACSLLLASSGACASVEEMNRSLLIDAPADDRSSGTPGGTSGASAEATAELDSGAPDTGPAATGTHRTSLSVCWTDATCKRAMVVAHGGDWTPTGAPYGSMSAVAAAYKNGVEAVKIDVRVTKDDVPVVSHSSPFTAYESLDCYNKKIEDMTAADVTKCHFVTGGGETFQRLDTMLDYARGKLVVQLCVKEPSDYARTIAEVVAKKAEDFAFIEITTNELQTIVPGIASGAAVRYLVNIESDYAQIDTLLDTIKNPRVFMIEMNASPQVKTLVTTKLHPKGVRSFIYDSGAATSEAQLKGYFDSGFDVVSANATANNVKARVAVNKARGVTPP